MGKLILHDIVLLDKTWNCDESTHANDRIEVYIKEEDSDGMHLFFLNIISKEYLALVVDDETKSHYLRYALVMSRYDEQCVKKQIDKILQRCNYCDGEQAFNCLSYYLEFEDEEWLYDTMDFE